MPSPATRATSRRAICLALAGMTTLATVHGASAEDGLGGFLSSIFGGNSAAQQPAAAPSVSSYQRPYTRQADYRHSSLPLGHFRQRPLIVRLHRAAPKLLVAQSPTKPGKVSIYEDKTLRRGDAVMTADGVRIFAGSSSWPYAAGDFVALTKAMDLNRDSAKALAEVDRLPRG